jgi:hypothetical protein
VVQVDGGLVANTHEHVQVTGAIYDSFGFDLRDLM